MPGETAPQPIEMGTDRPWMIEQASSELIGCPKAPDRLAQMGFELLCPATLIALDGDPLTTTFDHAGTGDLGWRGQLSLSGAEEIGHRTIELARLGTGAAAGAECRERGSGLLGALTAEPLPDPRHHGGRGGGFTTTAHGDGAHMPAEPWTVDTDLEISLLHQTASGRRGKEGDAGSGIGESGCPAPGVASGSQAPPRVAATGPAKPHWLVVRQTGRVCSALRLSWAPLASGGLHTM